MVLVQAGISAGGQWIGDVQVVGYQKLAPLAVEKLEAEHVAHLAQALQLYPGISGERRGIEKLVEVRGHRHHVVGIADRRRLGVVAQQPLRGLADQGP